MTRIAFLGLGVMGGPMARRLVQAGHELTVFDISDAAVERLRTSGARAAASPAAAARDAEFVFTSLPSPRVVHDVYLGPDGVLETARPEAILIDTSTVAPATAKALAAAAAVRGAAFLDAPVSGGPGGAANGTLTFMLGGTHDVVVRARPVLNVLASRVVHVGPHGSGLLMKLCNNLVAASAILSTAEALAIGRKGGLDRQMMVEVFSSSSAASWMLEHAIAPVVLNADAPLVFSIDGLQKDLSLFLQAATDEVAPAVMGTAVSQLLRAAQAAGLGAIDQSRIVEFYDRLVGNDR